MTNFSFVKAQSSQSSVTVFYTYNTQNEEAPWRDSLAVERVPSARWLCDRFQPGVKKPISKKRFHHLSCSLVSLDERYLNLIKMIYIALDTLWVRTAWIWDIRSYTIPWARERVSEWASERMSAAERASEASSAEQANKWAVRANKWAVRTSRLHAHLNHHAPLECKRTQSWRQSTQL